MRETVEFIEKDGTILSYNFDDRGEKIDDFGTGESYVLIRMNRGTDNTHQMLRNGLHPQNILRIPKSNFDEFARWFYNYYKAEHLLD